VVRTYAAAFAADFWQMILGFFLLGIILYASRGLVGVYDAVISRLEGKPRADTAPADEKTAKAMEAAE
jgi:hypothetical protein